MKLGFVGSGAMAEAIIKGLIGKGIYKGENIWVTNKKNDEKLIYMRENYGVNTTKNLEEFFKNIDIVIIAVKPKDVLGFLNSAKEYIKPNHIIISVAAGITTELIENTIGEDIRVIRAMPNISCEVGESATAIAKGRFSDEEALALSKEIFSSIGKTYIVEEGQLDAVTALSGSGPAYIYYMVEAMIEAGEKIGLTRNIAEKLALQTFYGAAKMAVEKREPLKKLREKVTSPNGTTYAAIKTLEKHGFQDIIYLAMQNAKKRALELMKES